AAMKRPYGERTCAACSSRNGSVFEEGGSSAKTSSIGFVGERPREFRNHKEDLYGRSKTVSQQGLQDEPALRASMVAGCDAQRPPLPRAGRRLRLRARRDSTDHVEARSREGLGAEVHRRDRIRQRSPSFAGTRTRARSAVDRRRSVEAVSSTLRRYR